MKIKVKWIFIIAAIIAVLYIISQLVKIYTTISKDETTWSATSIPAYDSLFSKATQKELHILSTVKSKRRQPESSYRLDSGYNLFVYRVIFKTAIVRRNFINVREGRSDHNNSEVYSTLPSSRFEMFKKEGAIDSISNVNLKYYGDDLQIIKKDSSIFCYYVLFKSLSISFDEEPFDIVANANKSIPAEIAFMRKGQYLYIILMTSENKITKIQPNQLLNMLAEVR